MRRDFTLDVYRSFLEAALEKGYLLTSYEDYVSRDLSDRKVLILRHDVDRLPQNSLATAMLQAELGVKGSYYFRIVPASFQPTYIKQIRDLGHEIGYHYEDMALAKGDVQQAITSFEQNLAKVSEFYPVKTICMHGSPLSKWDNRQIWEQYDYHDYGILAEPYFDIDFHRMLYITDTGRNWNKSSSSVRDKVSTSYNFQFASTYDLISQLKQGKLPDQIMQNIHPQRWSNTLTNWTQELIMQNIKNQVKKIIVKLQ
jgi:hypothetical protein